MPCRPADGRRYHRREHRHKPLVHWHEQFTTVPSRTLEASGLDLCIYHAGMDPHEDCDLGGLEGVTTGDVREWAEGR